MEARVNSNRKLRFGVRKEIDLVKILGWDLHAWAGATEMETGVVLLKYEYPTQQKISTPPIYYCTRSRVKTCACTTYCHKA